MNYFTFDYILVFCFFFFTVAIGISTNQVNRNNIQVEFYYIIN